MKELRVGGLAEALDVSVATVRRALAEAVAVAGEHALEVRGELKGRGFVARRARARRGEPWSFVIETPHQVTREAEAGIPPGEPGASLFEVTARLAGLSATIAELQGQLRLAERRAGKERDARLRLEGEVAALREQCERLSALLASRERHPPNSG